MYCCTVSEKNKVFLTAKEMRNPPCLAKERRNPPFLVLNPTLEDFLFIVGDQLERVDEAGGFVQGIARHHHKGCLGATNPNT